MKKITNQLIVLETPKSKDYYDKTSATGNVIRARTKPSRTTH